MTEAEFKIYEEEMVKKYNSDLNKIKTGDKYYNKNYKDIRLRVNKVEGYTIHFTYLHFSWSGSVPIWGFKNTYIKETFKSLLDFI